MLVLALGLHSTATSGYIGPFTLSLLRKMDIHTRHHGPFPE